MKFPIKVFARRNSPIFTTIYGQTKARRGYRVAWRADGERKMQSFAKFKGEDGALCFAQKTARSLARGSRTVALSSKEANDALLAREILDSFRRETGRRVSLLEAVQGYRDAIRQLGKEHSLTETVEFFKKNAALITAVKVEEAAQRFLAEKDERTKAPDGKRAKLSANYAYMMRLFVEKFVKAVSGHMVCDLQPRHLDAFMGSPALTRLADKSRNHHRNAIGTFLRWCVEEKMLNELQLEKLLKAKRMEKDAIDEMDPEFYRPSDLKKLLDAADEEIRPVIALSALAGLRVTESLRISWESVFKRDGYVTVDARIAKGRFRRIVTMGEALCAWLKPYRKRTGKVWHLSADSFHERFQALRKKQRIRPIKNGLRHGFVTHHFQLHGEEKTAKEAGHDAKMLHEHYKGLATEQEAEAWFSVRPGKAVKR